jgi:RNA polymerase sigma factor (sigma-70 family)
MKRAADDRGQAWVTAPTDATIEAAYRDHRTTLVLWLTGQTRDPELAEELAQEAYLRLLRITRSGEVVVDVRAWLFHAARNLLLDQGRRSQVADRHAGELARAEVVDGGVETAVLSHEWLRSLHRALGRLDPADRSLLLAAGAGGSGPELAGSLGVSNVALRTRLHRARRRLRAEFATSA